MSVLAFFGGLIWGWIITDWYRTRSAWRIEKIDGGWLVSKGSKAKASREDLTPAIQECLRLQNEGRRKGAVSE